MYDDITLSLLPAGADAYAGYVNGRFANMTALRAKFPHAHLLDISVFASGDATCLDVETGDATIAQVFAWFKRQEARGVWRPVIYTQATNLGPLYATMTANGIARGTYRVWSAHYGAGQHTCGPATCHFTLGGGAADGTQWTDTALGRSLDQSVLADNFFSSKPVVPAPAPAPGGPFRHVADGKQSLEAVARKRNTTAALMLVFNVTHAPLNPANKAALENYAAFDAAFFAAQGSRVVMPKGLVYYTANK